MFLDRSNFAINDYAEKILIKYLIITLCAFMQMSVCAQTGSGGSSNAPQSMELSPRKAASAPAVSNEIPVPPSAEVNARTVDNTDAKQSLQRLLNTDNASSYGTGVFTQRATPLAPTRQPPADDPPIAFSFENGDLREIVRNVLGDLLNENFTIDPQVQGTVTIRTSKPVRRSEVFTVLESMLRANGFGIVRDGKYWRVGVLSGLSRGYGVPQLSHRWLNGDRQGTNVAIYQANRVGANELKRLVEPFAKDPAVTLRIDDVRNWLIVTAPGSELERLLEIATMFDTSLIEGMSFSMVTLKNAEVKAVVTEYERIFGVSTNNPLLGLLRVIPLERINALLVVSPHADVVKDAERWIERLDQPGDTAGGQRLFVYNLRYTQAEKIQQLLSQAISGRAPTATTGPTVAPGQQSSTLTNSVPTPIAGQPNFVPGNMGSGTTPSTVQTPANASGIARTSTSLAGPNAGSTIPSRNATVVADKDRNALLILAVPSEYSAIESVIKKLDISPKQVAIEVQIAEVRLDGDFRFGLQSFFEGKLNDPQNRLTSALGKGQVTGGGFRYTWTKSDAIKAVLDLSETKSQIRTLAQPTLITLENQKATFSSGTQISVRTQTEVSNTVNTTSRDSFQYIPTGITLNVTPRISGDLVFMELQQEISDAGVPAGDNPNPPITRRAANTNVVVQSGDTMLLGGLFQEGSRNGSGGLPILSSIPIVGGLFGNQTWQSDRTELVLLITPRILNDTSEASDLVDELRKRLRSIEGLDWPVSTRTTSPSPLIIPRDKSNSTIAPNKNTQ
ncbi:MAG: type II secretion system secretin GspD [Casimicrobium sp.]